MRRFSVIAVLPALLCGAVPAGAHGLSTSYTDITLRPARLEVTYLLSINEIFTHFPVGVRADDETRSRSSMAPCRAPSPSLAST
jgi:hypothetical protein